MFKSPLSARNESRMCNIIHFIEIPLILAILVIAVYKIFSPSVVKTRGGTWGLGVAAKSLVFLTFILLTEHVRRLHRYGGLKCYMILSIIDQLFWFVGVGLTAIRLKTTPSGLGYTLSLVMIVLMVIMGLLATPVALIYTRQWLHFRKHGVHPDENHHSRERESRNPFVTPEEASQMSEYKSNISSA